MSSDSQYASPKTSKDLFSATGPGQGPDQGVGKGVRYSSRLMSALNKFTGGLAVPVENPLKVKYGEAYDYLIYGDTHRHQEDVETAITYYHHAITLREDMTEAHIGLGKCLKRKGDAVGAINAFKKALKNNAFDKDLHLDIAKCYTECGQLEKAISAYNRAIKLDPDYIEALFGLALVVEINGDNTQAIAVYKRIVEIDAEFLPAYNNLGSLYMRLSLFDESEALFKHLIDKAPSFSRGYLGLAITLDKSGKAKEALTAYRQVLTMKPNSRNTEFIERRILQLSKDLGMCKSSKATTLVRVK